MIPAAEAMAKMVRGTVVLMAMVVVLLTEEEESLSWEEDVPLVGSALEGRVPPYLVPMAAGLVAVDGEPGERDVAAGV